MGRSGQKKEKRGKIGELSIDNYNEGSAARTRPLSFDEIMTRRKSKNLSENLKEGAAEVGNKLGDCTTGNVSDHCKSERNHRFNQDSSHGVDKHLTEEFVKVGSREKEGSISAKDDNSARHRDRKSRESENKLRDESLTKSKYRESLRSEIRLKDGSLAKEKESRESRGSETRLKSEIKEIFSKAKGKADKQIPSEEKNYERYDNPKDESTKKYDNSKDESTKKYPRDLTEKDRQASRSGEKSGRESKRKHRSGDDEKNWDRNAVKKHDLAKRHDLEVSERKEKKESPRSRYGESSLKRRRSRSQEREYRSRRSRSLSPRVHKHSSYHGREREELSSHSLKGRSGRQHSEVDRSRVTSNGLNSHYRRHSGSTSGLGGYSPRKRRTDAAVKTPSPINRSPEKKSAKWDVAPAEKDNTFSDSVPSGFQMSNLTAPSNAHEVVRAIPVTSTAVKSLAEVSVSASLTEQNVSIDSLQLTEATQPVRRLYIENVPASVSEKALVEFLNNFLLSSGVDQIHGSLPCISCVMQKDKNQAHVEFLTAEDATAALSCDGSSFYGSILKIRRPKDFIDVASGEAEKSVAAVNAISDTVKDSPHKIFIGGISKTFSSKMFMEIASAFGSLRAYRFEVNEDRDESCAFLEYVDQSVTKKACAGLNGMKLGGQVLTVVQAVPDGLSSEHSGNSPFYGIPEHVIPLLEKPTQVLKLKNVFNPEDLASLSEAEVEEVLEDVRVECARFGTIKSVNVVKYGENHISKTEVCEASYNTASAMVEQNLRFDDTNEKAECLEVIYHQSEESNGLGFPNDTHGDKEVAEVEERNSVDDSELVGDLVMDDPCKQSKLDINIGEEDLAPESPSKTFSQEVFEKPNAFTDDSCCHDDKVACNIETEDIRLNNKPSAEEELNLEGVNRNLQEASAGLDKSVEMHSDAVQNGENRKQDHNAGSIFGPGCVFVEYRRAEASCIAAHCLHGRLFNDRVVTVEYVPVDLYKKRFPK